MSLTQPQQRLVYARKELLRCSDDLDEWQKQHEDVQDSCWVWEDSIAKLNFLFERFLALDTTIQQAVLSKRAPDDADIECALDGLFREWFKVSVRVLDEVVRAEKEHGSVEGADAFRANLNEARGMLTPDHEFFVGDKLAELCERAIDAHRAGQTSPLI